LHRQNFTYFVELEFGMDKLRKVAIDPSSEMGKSILRSLNDKDVIYESADSFLARMKKLLTEEKQKNVQRHSCAAF